MQNGNFDKIFKKYLDNCGKNKNTKCVIIITDKQCAITTLNEMILSADKLDDESHMNLMTSLEKEIHPNDNTSGWASYKMHDVYLFLEGPELTVNLPFSGLLSINQAKFLIDILGEVCKFNAENNDLITIDIMTSDDNKTYCSHDLLKIGKYILSQITEMYVTSDERIIGKTSVNNEIESLKEYEKH